MPKLRDILERNKEKTFIRRILEPERFPTLNLGEGKYATHMMTWSQVGDKYVVYPTVLYDGKKLNRYDPEAAWERVRETGNFIEFDNPKEADWFSRSYKAYWGKSAK
jgi:hypothetical protein